MRHSQQRENIKSGLMQYCVHPTAEELYMKLKPQNNELSLATVYRNLNKLAGSGLIKKIEGLSGKVHYDHNVDEHFHVICVNCGKINDLNIEFVDNTLKSLIENNTNYDILNYDIVVKGLCENCKISGTKKWKG